MLDLKTLAIQLDYELQQTMNNLIRTAPKAGEIMSSVNRMNREKSCALRSTLSGVQALIKIEADYSIEQHQSHETIPVVMLSNAA